MVFLLVLGFSTHNIVPVYLENPITSFPTLIATNYLSGSIGSSIGVIGGKRLNGQNYFLSCQSIKMTLEERHKFGYLTREVQDLDQETLKSRFGKETPFFNPR